MHYVIAYDVEKDRDRQRVLSLLKDFGVRVQYSVFECELDGKRLAELRERLRQVIDKRCDRVHVYAVCEGCLDKSESWGVERDGLGL
jgi:CRISPR-associated protein Cas2